MTFRAIRNQRGKWKTSRSHGEYVFIDSGVEHNPPPRTPRGKRRAEKRTK